MNNLKDYLEEEKRIFNYDIVQIIHNGNNAVLAQSDNSNQLILKAFEQSEQDYSSFFEINAIESRTNRFNLRHFISGQMVTLAERKEQQQQQSHDDALNSRNKSKSKKKHRNQLRSTLNSNQMTAGSSLHAGNHLNNNNRGNNTPRALLAHERHANTPNRRGFSASVSSFRNFARSSSFANATHLAQKHQSNLEKPEASPLSKENNALESGEIPETNQSKVSTPKDKPNQRKNQQSHFQQSQKPSYEEKKYNKSQQEIIELLQTEPTPIARTSLGGFHEQQSMLTGVTAVNDLSNSALPDDSLSESISSSTKKETVSLWKRTLSMRGKFEGNGGSSEKKTRSNTIDLPLILNNPLYFSARLSNSIKQQSSSSLSMSLQLPLAAGVAVAAAGSPTESKNLIEDFSAATAVPIMLTSPRMDISTEVRNDDQNMKLVLEIPNDLRSSNNGLEIDSNSTNKLTTAPIIPLIEQASISPSPSQNQSTTPFKWTKIENNNNNNNNTQQQEQKQHVPPTSSTSSTNLKASVRNLMRARKLGKSLGRIEQSTMTTTLPPRKPVVFEEEDLKTTAIAGTNIIVNPVKLPQFDLILASEASDLLDQQLEIQQVIRNIEGEEAMHSGSRSRKQLRKQASSTASSSDISDENEAAGARQEGNAEEEEQEEFDNHGDNKNEKSDEKVNNAKENDQIRGQSRSTAPILRLSPCFVKFIHKGQELVELPTNPLTTAANAGSITAATSTATIQVGVPSQSESAIRTGTDKHSFENGTGSLLDAKKLQQQQVGKGLLTRISSAVVPPIDAIGSSTTSPNKKKSGKGIGKQMSTLHFEAKLEEMIARQQNCAATLYKRTECAFVDKISRSGFRIVRIPNSLRRVLQWAVSAQEQLQEFCGYLQYSRMSSTFDQQQQSHSFGTSELTHKRIKRIIKCMRSMNTKLDACTSISTKREIQNVLIDTKITTQIICVLHSLTDSTAGTATSSSNKRKSPVAVKITNNSNPIEKNESAASVFQGLASSSEMISSLLMDLLRVCYLVLNNIVRNNQKAKLMVCQNLELFVLHAFQFLDENTIHLFLSELFYDNYRTISELISPKSIKYIIYQIVKTPSRPHPIHCKILSALTQSNNTAIADNQNAIIDHFFANKKRHIPFHFYFQHKIAPQMPGDDSLPLRSFNEVVIKCQGIQQASSNESNLMRSSNKQASMNQFGQMQLSTTIQEEYISIQKFQELSIAQNNNLRMFKYFIAYVDLLANICYSRNKKGKDLVESILSIDQILLLLNQNKNILSGSSKTPFLKLLQHAFIDVSETYLIPKILKVREWNLVTSQSGMNKSSNLKHIEEIERVLDYLLEFFTWNDSLSPVDDSLNLEILTMLEMFKKASDLGILTDSHRINEFIPTFINIFKSNLSISDENASSNETKKIAGNSGVTGIAKIKLDVNMTIIQKCKQLITGILQEYLDIQVNIKLGLILKQFKRHIEDVSSFPNPTTSSSGSPPSSSSEEVAERWIGFFKNESTSSPNLSSSNEEECVVESGNQKEMIELRGIDLTLMQQLVSKNNASILDSILHLLKRVYSQKKELFSSFQKIILVRGGIAEQITRNIPRYRLSFEKLKELEFLTELNRVPQEIEDSTQNNNNTSSLSQHHQSTFNQNYPIQEQSGEGHTDRESAVNNNSKDKNENDDIHQKQAKSRQLEYQVSFSDKAVVAQQNINDDISGSSNGGQQQQQYKQHSVTQPVIAKSLSVKERQQIFQQKILSNQKKDKIASLFRQFIKQGKAAQEDSIEKLTSQSSIGAGENSSQGNQWENRQKQKDGLMLSSQISEDYQENQNENSSSFESEDSSNVSDNDDEDIDDEMDSPKRKSKKVVGSSHVRAKQTVYGTASTKAIIAKSSNGTGTGIGTRFSRLRKGWQELRIRSFNYYEFLLADLKQLTTFMKEDFNKSGSGSARIEIIEVLSKDSPFFHLNSNKHVMKNFVHERELNNLLIQNLIRSHELHPTLFKYLSSIEEESKGNSNGGVVLSASNVRVDNLIEGIFEFLTVMIWNNHEAKMELLKMKQIAFDLIARNCGALEFLKELYTNVKPLLLNQSEISKVTGTMLRTANAMSQNRLFQSKLVHFLRTLVVHNDQPIKVNQGIIFQEITSSSAYDSIDIYSIKTQERVLRDLPKWVAEYEIAFDRILNAGGEEQYLNAPIIGMTSQNKKEVKNIPALEIHPEITYMMAIFSLFSLLVEGGHQINLKKSRKLHPLSFLINLLDRAGTCIPLKKEIRGYINRVYYSEIQENHAKNHKRKQKLEQILLDRNYIDPDDSTVTVKTTPTKITTKLFQQQSPKSSKAQKRGTINFSPQMISSISTPNFRARSESSPLLENNNYNNMVMIEDESTRINLQGSPANFQERESFFTDLEERLFFFEPSEKIEEEVESIFSMVKENEKDDNLESIEIDFLRLTKSADSNKYSDLISQKPSMQLNNVQLSMYREESKNQQIAQETLFEKDGMFGLIGIEFFVLANDLNAHLSRLLLSANEQITTDSLVFSNALRFRFWKSYDFLHVREMLATLYFLFGSLPFLRGLRNHFESIEKQITRAQTSKNQHTRTMRLFDHYQNKGNQDQDNNDVLTNKVDYLRTCLESIADKLSRIAQITKSNTSQIQFNQKANNQLVHDFIVKRIKLFLDRLPQFTVVEENNYESQQQQQQQLELDQKQQEIYYQQSNYCLTFNYLNRIQIKQNNVIEQKEKLKELFGKQATLNTQMSISTDLQEIRDDLSGFNHEQALNDPQVKDIINLELQSQLEIIDASPTFQQFIEKHNYDEVVWTNFVMGTTSKFKQATSNTPPNPEIPNQKRSFIYSVIRAALNHPNLTDDTLIFYMNILNSDIKKSKKQQAEQQSNREEVEEDRATNSGYACKTTESMRTMISSLGGAKLICRLLKKENLEQHLELVSTTLLFGINLLFGGHRYTQNRILTILQEDSENIILTNLRKLIERIGRMISSASSEEKERRKRNRLMNIDTYDFYHPEMRQMVRRNTRVDEVRSGKANFELSILVLKRIFHFLQLCCEKNMVQMKNFLREQVHADGRPRSSTINFIHVSTQTTREFLKVFNQSTLEITAVITEFLIEVTQVPCLQNQISLCQTSFFEDVSHFASIRHSKPQDSQELKQIYEQTTLFGGNKQASENTLISFYFKVIQSALVVLEGCEKEIYEEVNGKLSLELLSIIVWTHLNRMNVRRVGELKVYLKTNAEGGLFDWRVLEILSILMVVRRCSEHDAHVTERFREIFSEGYSSFSVLDSCFSPHSSNSNSNNNKNISEQSSVRAAFNSILDFLNERIATIEISADTNKSRRNVYFVRMPLYDLVSKRARSRLMKEVNRETQRTKILDLLERKESLYAQMLHNYYLDHSAIPATGANLIKLEKVLIWIIFVCNAYLLLLTSVTAKKSTGMLIHFNSEIEQFVFLTLMWTFFFFVLIFLVFMAVNQVPPKSKQPPQQQQILSRQKIFEQIPQDQQKSGIISASETATRSKNYRRNLLGKYVSRFKLAQGQLLNLLYHEEFPYLAFLVFIGFASLLIHPRFMVASLAFAFSKLKFVQGVLENLYQALFQQWKQLFLVSLLQVLFLYIFSVIWFDNYLDGLLGKQKPIPPKIENSILNQGPIMSPSEGEGPQVQCNSLLSCMVSLNFSGVIGKSLSEWNTSMFLSDTVYMVFMSILFSKIISSLMTDTFADMRDVRNSIENDMKNTCFICGIERSTLEKQDQNTFESHITKHLLWDYIFYIYSLKIKSETEYTGIEYMITDKLRKGDISWIPNNTHLNQ